MITDSNVLKLYAKPISEKLLHAGFKVDLFVFPAGEKSKTRETKARIEDAMLEKGYRRDCAILAVGGGVVTDLAGFVAGTYGRGFRLLIMRRRSLRPRMPPWAERRRWTRPLRPT